MRIVNGKIFSGHRFTDGELDFSDRIFPGPIPGDTEVYDVKGAYVVPGFIDIHNHGSLNADYSDSPSEDLEKISRHYALHGTTSFFASTMTLTEDELSRAINSINGFFPGKNARCSGIHLEGPFLSFAKKGAQRADALHKPDIDMFERLYELSGGKIRMVTVAPEEDGAIKFIEHVSQKCTVALGHSVADYDTAMRAYEAGATHATHLFNVMPPLHHRMPGIIGAAFDSGATVELICDGLHIHPSVIRMVHGLFGEKLCLISDALKCAGMPDGEYIFGGQPMILKNGKATMKEDGVLAGSVITIHDAVRNLVRFGIPLEDAVYAASAAPAKAVGLSDVGSLEPGKKADIVVLSEDLEIISVFINGKRVGSQQL